MGKFRITDRKQWTDEGKALLLEMWGRVPWEKLAATFPGRSYKSMKMVVYKLRKDAKEADDFEPNRDPPPPDPLNLTMREWGFIDRKGQLKPSVGVRCAA